MKTVLLNNIDNLKNLILVKDKYDTLFFTEEKDYLRTLDSNNIELYKAHSMILNGTLYIRATNPTKKIMDLKAAYQRVSE
jgi:hypothetical protein